MPLSDRQMLDSPQSDALRRLGGAGGRPGRASRDRPPRLDRPAGRRHRREGESRNRPPAFEPEVLPDDRGHQTAAGVLGFATPSDFVRAYPVSSEWLTLLIRRMDTVASIYRLARINSPRNRRLSVARGVSPQRPIRRHHCPHTMAAGSALFARARPCGAGRSTTG